MSNPNTQPPRRPAGEPNRDHHAEWDADREAEERSWVRKGKEDVRDEGALASLGRAVLQPVEDAGETSHKKTGD